MSDASKAYDEVKNCVINDEEEDANMFEMLLNAEDETGAAGEKTAVAEGEEQQQEEMWI